MKPVTYLLTLENNWAGEQNVTGTAQAYLLPQTGSANNVVSVFSFELVFALLTALLIAFNKGYLWPANTLIYPLHTSQQTIVERLLGPEQLMSSCLNAAATPSMHGWHLPLY